MRRRKMGSALCRTYSAAIVSPTANTARSASSTFHQRLGLGNADVSEVTAMGLLKRLSGDIQTVWEDVDPFRRKESLPVPVHCRPLAEEKLFPSPAPAEGAGLRGGQWSLP